jgi:predicted TPR repeat methyltransferase
MRDAREALRNGDPRACITLVERAMEAGASSAALRLRGDCLTRAGDRAAALRAYERFCLLAPDHPAISEVRATVESMGGHCN